MIECKVKSYFPENMSAVITTLLQLNYFCGHKKCQTASSRNIVSSLLYFFLQIVYKEWLAVGELIVISDLYTDSGRTKKAEIAVSLKDNIDYIMPTISKHNHIPPNLSSAPNSLMAYNLWPRHYFGRYQRFSSFFQPSSNHNLMVLPII